MRQYTFLSLAALLATSSIAAPSQPANVNARDAPAAPAFVLIPPKTAGCNPASGTAAPASSSSQYCFNLPAVGMNDDTEGTWIWPDDDTYQSMFFTATDCPKDKQEVQGGQGSPFIYSKKTDSGVNGTHECLGAVWSWNDQPGSVWMSPASVAAPGGWPANPARRV